MIRLLHEVEARVNLLPLDLVIEIGSHDDWLIDTMVAPAQERRRPWRSLTWWIRHRLMRG